MKSILLKIILIFVILFILTIVGLFIGGLILWHNFRQAYSYKECPYEKVVAKVEKLLKVNFPDEIQVARSAKAENWENDSIHYLVKFNAKPNKVNEFLKSFSKKTKYEPYNAKSDYRLGFAFNAPKWFTEPPIKKGKEVYISWTGYPATYIYIDETNEKLFVVYMLGSY